MAKGIKLATAPVSWGVDHMGRPDLPPWSVVLDQINDAGFHYTELGPLGYLPEAWDDDPVIVPFTDIARYFREWDA
jgi:sugar phosphate isomerase/epimerase